MPEWDPEVSLDAERARALIDTQFPELLGSTIAELGTGWDNVVYLVAGEWAFRFPRRAIAVPGVEREIDVLGRLAGHLPLPIPRPRWVGAPTTDYPWPWFGSALLPGTELALAGQPDDDRSGVAAALGSFLRSLHASALVRLVGASLPVDINRRADMAFRVPATRRRLADLVAAGLWVPQSDVDALLDDAKGLPPPPRTTLIHGDLHMRHVLVDGNGQASGVIDWGDVCIGDPSVDLSIAFGSFTGPARRALLDAYGPIDGLTELRSRVIATFLSAALLAYAVDVGLEPLEQEARRALERVVA